MQINLFLIYLSINDFDGFVEILKSFQILFFILFLSIIVYPSIIASQFHLSKQVYAKTHVYSTVNRVYLHVICLSAHFVLSICLIGQLLSHFYFLVLHVA